VAEVTHSFASSSADETHQLGEKLGRALLAGDFVGLIGELGAGKTQFARGVAAGAGVDRSEVASPTFAVVYPYRGRLALFHADLYRLSDYDELYATGFFDLLTEGAMLVEWIDRIPQAAPDDHLEVRFEVASDDERKLVARATGARAGELLERWIKIPSPQAGEG
jgi:tRNA threonylcarbamoyladenosine biosynthesis protein TsaE